MASDLKSAYYHFSLAKMYHLSEDFPKAITQYEKAIQADPESPALLSEFAKSLLRAGQVQRAVEANQKAVELAPDDPEVRYALARIYFTYRRQGSMRARASLELSKVLELDANHADALNDLAQLRWESRDYAESAELFHRLRQLESGSIRPNFLEAQALIELGDLEKAIKVLEEGLLLRDDVPEYLILLGGLYQRTGHAEQAVQLYRNGLKKGLDPGLKKALAEALLQSGRNDEAIPLLEQMVTASPMAPELKLDLARALRQKKQLDEAAKILQDLVEDHPDNVQANYELANILAILGEKREAADRYRKLIEMSGADADKFRNLFKTSLAMLLADSGRSDESLQLLREVTEDEPDNIDAKLRLLYAYKQASRPQDALEVSASLMEQEAKNHYVIIGRAQALAAAGRLSEAVDFLRNRYQKSDDPALLYWATSQLYINEEAFPKAQAELKEALARYPESSRLRFQLGAVLERQKQYNEAEEQFKKVLGDDPDDADTLNYLGYMLAERGVRLDEALDYVQRAVEIDPFNGSYLDSLGWVYFKQNNLEKAEIHLRKAARLNQSDSVILEHLGDLYSKRGEQAKAIEFYEESISHAESGQDSERLQKKLKALNQRPSGR